MSAQQYSDGLYPDAYGNVVDHQQYQGRQHQQQQHQQPQYASHHDFDDDLDNHHGSSFDGNQGNERKSHRSRPRRARPDNDPRLAEFVKQSQTSLGGLEHSSSSKSRKTKSSARNRASQGIASFEDKFNSSNSSNPSTQQVYAATQPYATQQAYGAQQAYPGQSSYAAQQPYYPTQHFSANGQQVYGSHNNQYGSGH